MQWISVVTIVLSHFWQNILRLYGMNFYQQGPIALVPM